MSAFCWVLHGWRESDSLVRKHHALRTKWVWGAQLVQSFFPFSAYFSYSAQTFSQSEFSMVSALTSKSHRRIVPHSTNVQHRRQDEWCSTMPYYPEVAYFPATSRSGLYHSDLPMITMSNLLMKDASCILMLCTKITFSGTSRRQVSPCYHCKQSNSLSASVSLLKTTPPPTQKTKSYFITLLFL